MAILVLHIRTERNYVFLGAGYGSWATDKPGVLGFGDRNEGQESMVYVCDSDGRIKKMHPAELVVVSVDGVPVSEVLCP